MADTTEIAWADSTFNPWIGCTKVGPGCDHCYAEADFDLRKHRVKWGAGNPRSRTSAANWKKPIQWNAQPFSECMCCGWRGELRDAEVITNPSGFYPSVDTASLCPNCREPMLKAARRRVFCSSLADVFDNEVPEQWRIDLFRLIEATPNFDWLLLTKRIGNAAPMMFAARGGHLPLMQNVWIGATICNQAEAERDIPKLLQTPAAVRFVSIEPLLGPIDLERPRPGPDLDQGHGAKICQPWLIQSGIDWVIVGGESGPHARPMHPDWVRSLRDQCADAGVPYLFKQWGEWRPPEDCEEYDTTMGRAQRVPAFIVATSGSVHCFENEQTLDGGRPMLRVGKKAAGRLLDGVQHDGFPVAL